MYGLNNQKMKVKFLGTSAVWPLPRLGCNCELCSSVDPKDTRTRTQLLVNDTILLDAGPDTYHHLLSYNRHPRPSVIPAKAGIEISPSGDRILNQVENDKRVDPTKIKAILISHAHLDHIQGF